MGTELGGMPEQRAAAPLLLHQTCFLLDVRCNCVVIPWCGHTWTPKMPHAPLPPSHLQDLRSGLIRTPLPPMETFLDGERVITRAPCGLDRRLRPDR